MALNESSIHSGGTRGQEENAPKQASADFQQHPTVEARPRDCAPITIKLQITERLIFINKIGCVCGLTPKLFREHLISFEDRYALVKGTRYQARVVHHGNDAEDHDRGTQLDAHVHGDWNVIHPGNDESEVYDRMITCNMFHDLVKQGCSASGREISLKPLKESLSRIL